MGEVDEIKRLLERCSEAERKAIFDLLRRQFPIHALEAKLNAPAELILEAIDRSSDLIKRGIRGVIAEAAFRLHVVSKLEGWDSQELLGDFPYDFVLQDKLGKVRVQVKMQRLKEHVPMTANQGYRGLPADMYVVETQRTRGGRDQQTATPDPTGSENLIFWLYRCSHRLTTGRPSSIQLQAGSCRGRRIGV
jgi:hypothetical protein